MESKNLITLIVIIVVIVVLGYFLFFRGSVNQDNSGYYGSSPSMMKQKNPANNQQVPPGDLSSQPSASQEKELATPNTNPNMNTNTGDNTNKNQGTITNVTIRNFTFSPAQVTVKAGTTVKWVNQDSKAHTTASDDNKFESGNLSNGDSYQFTFTTPGTYAYHCGIHPMMKGTVVVQ